MLPLLAKIKIVISLFYQYTKQTSFDMFVTFPYISKLNLNILFENLLVVKWIHTKAPKLSA